MKEILFRGKPKNRKSDEWIYGSLVKGIAKFDGNPVFFIYGPDTEIDGRGWIGNHYGEEVIPETVCQYIEVDDKDCVKIFEKDLVKDSIGNLYCVMLIDSAFHIVGLRDHNHTVVDEETKKWLSERCTVVGNEYDNPEMLV